MLVRDANDLDASLTRLAAWKGPFVSQEYIDHGGRDVRVVVIGDRFRTYWRRQPDPREFRNNICRGALIDDRSDPDLLQAAEDAVRGFCALSRINLAAFDLVYDRTRPRETGPLFLEINYNFGRQGLSGSAAYYQTLREAVGRWIEALPVHAPEPERGRVSWT
jgi:ribosomal protein S6--L-glutamate ligase